MSNPKNILMIGPQGGKVPQAGRLVNAPTKVEATKFTEVVHGRDVDSIIRSFVENAIRMVKSEKMAGVYHRWKQLMTGFWTSWFPHPPGNPARTLCYANGGFGVERDDEGFQKRLKKPAPSGEAESQACAGERRCIVKRRIRPPYA